MEPSNISNQVVWEALRNTNSFILKKSNGPFQFTREPFNPNNTHSYKYSSTAQLSNILSVEREGEYDAGLVTTNGDELAVFKPKGIIEKKVLKDASGPTRNNKKIIDAVEKAFYRRDLKDIVLQRYTKLYKAAQKKRKNRASE